MKNCNIEKERRLKGMFSRYLVYNKSGKIAFFLTIKNLAYTSVRTIQANFHRAEPLFQRPLFLTLLIDGRSFFVFRSTELIIASEETKPIDIESNM